jgi:hypothetical protein
MRIEEGRVYLLDDIPVMTIGIAEGYKGEAVVIYKGPKNKLNIMTLNDFINKAEEVEKLL